MIPHLLPAYRSTVWFLPHSVRGNVAILGAWNPGSQRRTTSANLAMDLRLQGQIASGAVRVIGASADGLWFEEMWIVPYDRHHVLRLLLRFGQHSALIRQGGRWRLLWRNGICQPGGGRRATLSVAVRTMFRSTMKKTLTEPSSQSPSKIRKANLPLDG